MKEMEATGDIFCSFFFSSPAPYLTLFSQAGNTALHHASSIGLPLTWTALEAAGACRWRMNKAGETSAGLQAGLAAGAGQALFARHRAVSHSLKRFRFLDHILYLLVNSGGTAKTTAPRCCAVGSVHNTVDFGGGDSIPSFTESWERGGGGGAVRGALNQRTRQIVQGTFSS